MRAGVLWLTWVGLLAASVPLSLFVSMHDPVDAEADAIRTVQSWLVPGKMFSDTVRAVTSTTIVLVFGAGLAATLWWQGARRKAVALMVLFAVLPLAQAGLKQLVDRPRPPEELIRAGYSSPSFPAGHVMGPVVVYGALLWLGLFWSRWNWWWRVAAVCWSTVILATTGIVNVYLGVHWPTDVLGGYLWGLVLLLPVVTLISEPHTLRNDRTS